MSFDWQLMIVIVLTLAAALYTGRSFLGQFRRSEDESEGCSGCPAARAAEQPGESSKPAAGSGVRPTDH